MEGRTVLLGGNLFDLLYSTAGLGRMPQVVVIEALLLAALVMRDSRDQFPYGGLREWERS